MGIRMTGLGSGVDPKMVEQLVKAQRIPIETAKKRREKFVEEKKEFGKFDKAISEFDSVLGKLKTRGDFYKLKVESSHPDIIDGLVKTDALPGSYEFEVRGLARSDKQLAYGFPDKDKTAVGFGFMLVHREDMDPLDITIDPGATLSDVAGKINDAQAGVRAMVINTKYGEESYRLLVVSEKSGKEARIEIDPDTTFLEFKNQVAGQNLDVLFEDVPVTDVKNQLDELVEGVVFNVKRSEPGTRVQVNITYDLEETVKGIKDFVDKYNAISQFAYDQQKYDEEARKSGTLGGDGSLKTVMRQLQTKFSEVINTGSKFRTLADIGITTNPKIGTLNLDEAKVKQCLAEDYDGVAKLFMRGPNGEGIAERMAGALKGLKDPTNGVLKSRLRGMDTIIKTQDKDIEKRERQFEATEQSIRRKFQVLEGTMSNLQAQGNFLQARLATPQMGGGGGGAAGGGGGGGEG